MHNATAGWGCQGNYLPAPYRSAIHCPFGIQYAHLVSVCKHPLCWSARWRRSRSQCAKRARITAEASQLFDRAFSFTASPDEKESRFCAMPADIPST
jgi:hypothetical protein